MNMSMPLNSMSNAILLLALGVGYIVFYLANKEGKTMKLLGNVIGAFIIVVAGTLVLTNILVGMTSLGTCAMSSKTCMMTKHHNMMMQQQAVPPATTKAEIK
ncbi:MAG: hypothetical protein NT033_05440 [Candidatus Omnitrophica bacterium]|nr:hypothetical protein [Candidatus Omnitrophota bacterium]